MRAGGSVGRLSCHRIRPGAEFLPRDPSFEDLASQIASGTVVIVASLRRYDLRENTVDQQSFGVVYIPGSTPDISSAMWKPVAGSLRSVALLNRYQATGAARSRPVLAGAGVGDNGNNLATSCLGA